MRHYFRFVLALFFYTMPAGSSWIELIDRKNAPRSTGFQVLDTDQYPALHRNRDSNVSNIEQVSNPNVDRQLVPAQSQELDNLNRFGDEDEVSCRSEEHAKIVFVFDGKYPFYSRNPDRVHSEFYIQLAQNNRQTLLIDNMYDLFHHISIGVTSYSDWKTTNEDLLYCYKFKHQKLNPGLLYTEIYPDNAFPQNGTEGWDSVLNAVLYTAMDGNMDWGNGKKVVIFVSNKKWKWEGDSNNHKGPEYQLPSITKDMMGDNRNKFCDYKPISKKLFFDLTENYKIIGLLTPKGSDPANNFFNNPPKNKENYKMLRISGTDTDGAKSIETVLFPALRKYLCTCKVVYEFALVVDATMTFIEFEKKSFFQPKSYPECIISFASYN
ncbi:uncharacterized protein LOC118437790 [Folsomia candida]|uniref:uncharacterized protein LOC118437790 n=1 Tax=Folsomia candida TaxID=158441 RepID=UPI001604AA58|nr:uncharacterized protein LOC118437790 [Folsomia candida]